MHLLPSASRACAALAGAALVATATGCSSSTETRAPSTSTRQAAHTAPDRIVRLATRSDLRPPKVVMSRAGGRGGLIFLGPKKVFGAKKTPGEQYGPMIVDGQGRTRWFRPVPKGLAATDVQAGTYRGKPVLTYWEGRLVNGHGKGEGIVLDDRYRLVRRVRGHGAKTDLHNFTLTSRGTALMTVYRSVTRDLRAVGGPRRGRVLDGIVQEIDVATGKLVWEWHSLDHVSIRESYLPVSEKSGGSWDYFHVNSADLTPDGDVLISSRDTSTVFKVDHRTGRIVWRLGGKHGDFHLGRGVRFTWQHDARSLGSDTLSIFDNAVGPKPVRSSSRVIVVRVDTRRHRARLLRSYVHPDRLSAGTQGNGQLMPSGDMFAGWGSRGAFTQFTRRGRVLFDARLPRGWDSYRAFRMPWRGRPAGVPAASARRSGDRTRVSASFNGSTDVVRWRVLAGPSRDRLSAVATAPWRNLETAISLKTREPWVAVEALDRSGRVLARSHPARSRG